MRLNQDSEKQIKIYLFSYSYDNAQWSIEISAYSKEDAIEIMKQLSLANYDGELQMKIPVPSNN